VTIKNFGQRTSGLSWMHFGIVVGKFSYRKMVDGQHKERVGEVLCCVNWVREREMMDQVERS
jgi:hypothetical protein